MPYSVRLQLGCAADLKIGTTVKQGEKSLTVSLDDVAAKVEAGERLSDEDVQALESGRDIISLGMLADSVRRKMHGPTITFVRVFDLTLEAGPKGPALRTESRPGLFGPGDVPPDAGEVAKLFESFQITG